MLVCIKNNEFFLIDMNVNKTSLFESFSMIYGKDPLRNTQITIPLLYHDFGGVTDWHQSLSYREPNCFLKQIGL